MHPDVLRLLSDKLSEMAVKDLGLNLTFEWPDDPVPGSKNTTVNIRPDRALSQEERQRLEAWTRDKLGAEWRPTIWERLLDA